MKFSYEAFDMGGHKVCGTLEADALTEASALLRKQGLFSGTMKALNDDESDNPMPVRQKTPGKLFGNKLKNLSGFCREVHILMSSGTPLVQCLGAVERQATDENWRGVVQLLRERVESGSSLASAMAVHPGYFDSVCHSLVSAGELSGNLSAMMERLSIVLRKQQRLRTALIGAMIYPCLLIVIAFTVIGVMLMFVLPRFSDLFKTLDSPLPPTTRFLLGTGDWLHGHWWIPLSSAALGITLFVLWLRGPRARGVMSSMALKLPKIGFLMRNLASARIARILGMLLESKLPLVEALKLTRTSLGVPQYYQLLQEAEEAVVKGNPMSSVLAGSDLIAPYIRETLRNGEQSGKVGAPLVQMADFMDEENEVIVKTMTNLLEPIILIVLGAIVGLMALSMFLPLFDLVANAGKGGS